MLFYKGKNDSQISNLPISNSFFLPHHETLETEETCASVWSDYDVNNSVFFIGIKINVSNRRCYVLCEVRLSLLFKLVRNILFCS